MKKYISPFLFAMSAFPFFYACGGSETKSAPAELSTQATTPETSAQASVSGEEVYKRTCIACHQVNGEGIAGTFPPLAKSDYLMNRKEVIHQVIEGKTGEMIVNGVKYNSIMPPQTLNDEEIAAVLTYVYSSWGNSGAPVTTDEVKSVRVPKI